MYIVYFQNRWLYHILVEYSVILVYENIIMLTDFILYNSKMAYIHKKDGQARGSISMEIDFLWFCHRSINSVTIVLNGVIKDSIW